MSGTARLPPATTLLVTAAGTATGYGVVRTLRDRFADQLRIIITDTNPVELVAASALADGFHRMPGFAQSAFAPRLAELLEAERVTLYWPLLDAEIVLAGELAADGRLPPRTSLLAPPLSSARLCLDKLELSAWLTERGFPVPRTASFDRARVPQLPVFVKPRAAWGSTGARLVETADEWFSLGTRTELVVQQACSPPEVTVDGFRSHDGRVTRALARERIEVKAGVCTKARVYEEAGAAALARRLGDALGLEGAFCFQTMLGPAGDQLITDVNPRPGGGTRLTVATGVDPLSASLLDRVGEDVTGCLPPLEGEHTVVRHWEELVMRPSPRQPAISSGSGQALFGA